MRQDSIADLLAMRAMEHPSAPFLSFSEEKICYAEALHRVRCVGGGFVAAGIARGDRVAIMLSNRSEFIVAWFALSGVGAIMVPINVAYKAKEVGHILGHAEVTAVVCDKDSSSVIDQALAAHARQCIVWNVDAPAAIGERPFHTLVQGNPVDFAEANENTVVSILYTSGTTGASKGCMHGNHFYTKTGQLFAGRLGIAATDTLLTPLPLFHANAQAGTVMGALAAGACVTVLDRFHPTTFIDSCRQHGASVVFYMGVMPAMLMTLPASEQDRDHKIRVASGAGIPVRLHRDFEARFGFPCVENYGMTETATVSMASLNADRAVGKGVVGKPCEGVEIRLIDAEGCEVPTGAAGELLVRTPTMLIGYFRDAAATRAAFVDGLFRTGDQVMQDEYGDLYFCDRIKDVIRRSGVNIATLEIETVLRRHPGVEDVAVLGVPDAIRGEEIRASIVFRENVVPSRAIFRELADFVAANLATFKIPRFWESRNSLPRTPTLKTRKYLLRAERSDLAAGCWDRQMPDQVQSETL